MYSSFPASPSCQGLWIVNCFFPDLFESLNSCLIGLEFSLIPYVSHLDAAWFEFGKSSLTRQSCFWIWSFPRLKLLESGMIPSQKKHVQCDCNSISLLFTVAAKIHQAWIQDMFGEFPWGILIQWSFPMARWVVTLTTSVAVAHDLGYPIQGSHWTVLFA